MLREDKKLELIRLDATLPRMFTGRWALQSGQRIYSDRWKDAQVAAWCDEQVRQPVLLRRERRRSLWWFRDRFYWDDDGHSSDDVKALALQRLRREDRRLKSARSLMNGEEASGRAALPAGVVRAVIERDGLRCVQCGSAAELQLDHILPVALGGATSVENLQVLCRDCNRAKSDSL